MKILQSKRKPAFAGIWAVMLAVISGSHRAAAQAANSPVEMADTMRANGKIYVVVLVLATILILLIAFLVLIDRKVSKIERSLDKK